MPKCKICGQPIFGNKNTKFCYLHKDKKQREKLKRKTYLYCLNQLQRITSEDNPFAIGRDLREYFRAETGVYSKI